MKLSEIAAEYLAEKSQRRRITTVAGYVSALRYPDATLNV